MDCFRLFHLNRAILNNNAMACYDQMIPEVTSLHLQSLGLPEEAVKCSMLLNHNMRHHVKTTAGVSSEHYRHKPENEKYGEGQGKTSSPSNWLFQISTMLSALYCLVLAINMFSVCKQYVEDRIAEFFVNDTDCTYLEQHDQKMRHRQEYATDYNPLPRRGRILFLDLEGACPMTKRIGG
eukprot:9073548-Ditylum_brightwellii.AAC.1